MKNKDRLNIKVGSIIIRISSINGGEIIDFLRKDFMAFECQELDRPYVDVDIDIIFDKFECPNDTANLSSNILIHNEKIYMKISGRLRSIWAEIESKPHLGSKVKIFIPEEYLVVNKLTLVKEQFFRMLFPNFLYRWQNSLIDIFHGLLLGLTQLNLVRVGEALLHASAISSANGEGIIFPGWAQSGKSTIADRLVKKKNWKFIAEDLCLLSLNAEIFSYPKQRRFYYKELNRTKYFNEVKTASEKALDRLNYLSHKLFRLSEPIRILSVGEIFDRNDFEISSNLNSIIFLVRGNFQEMQLKNIQIESMANMCTDMMFFEMQNFNGFYQLLSAYGVMSGNSDLIKMITQNLRQIYISIFKEAKCYILEVPETQELGFIENDLHFKLENIILSKHDN